MKNKIDSLNGDHSFKKWFEIMWKNTYIFLFFVGLGGMICQIVLWNDMIEMLKDNYSYSIMGAIMSTIGMLIPSAITGLISYKGFYQKWKELKGE
mgnify:CR=1 FL=1